MPDIKKAFLKSSGGVIAATMTSRMLGLARTVCEARFLGGGSLMTAWDVAFMVPNLFRRLFGEGAMGHALVPLISHTLEKQGKGQSRRDLATVFSMLSFILSVLCVLVAIFSIFAVKLSDTPRVKMIFQVLPLIIPYALFICLTGAIISVLSSFKVYFLPALSAISMNIFMIGAMVLIVPMFAGDSIAILNTLSFAVLISGVVQFVFVSFLLWRNGLFPSFSFEALKNIPLLVEFWRLALPSMIGASALQISLLVDKSLACWLGPYAEPALKYSDRIIYFPVGVFAVSFGFVALAEMSRALAANDENRMISTLEFSLRHILFICIPIAFFVFFFREPSIRLMFLGGEFNMKSLEETAYAMFFYSFGIPFFASTKIIVSAFNSRKDTKTPMRVSLFCIGLNIVLNLILMVPLRQGGIALATVLAAVMNNVILLAVLKRRVSGISFGRLWITSLAGAGIALISVLAAKFAYGRLFIFPKTSYLPDNIFPFLISGFLFVFLYTVLSALSGCPEVREISGIFLRRGSNIE